jgi:arylsulfatase A-like enzyme
MIETKRPNILIFITDQFNPNCVGYAGHPVVRTPHLDRLAKQGMIFTRAYSNQPLCMPARATLFTGLTPRGHGVRMNGIPLNPAVPTFTEALRQNGYHTHCCGKIHLHMSGVPRGASPEQLNPHDYPENRSLWIDGVIRDLPTPYYGLESVDFANGHGHYSYGYYLHWLLAEHPDKAHLFLNHTPLESPSPAAELFNRSSYKWALPFELHPAKWIADRTIDFLEKSADEERPFALMCSFQEPHPPFAPPAPYCYRYNPADVPRPIGREGETEDLPPHFAQMRETDVRTSGNHSQPMNATDPYRAECAAHYYGLIEMVDDQIGRVMAALDRTVFAENTVVIFLSDHGEALGDHGMWGKGPYHFDSVIRVPFLVVWPGHVQPESRCDDVVSLIDFAPTILDITNIPVPEGANPPTSEASNAPPSWPGRSLLPILEGEDKAAGRSALVEMDEDYLGFRIRTLITSRYRLTVYSGQEYGELFDLENDPDELENLWDDPSQRETRDALQIELLQKIIDTDVSLPRQMGRA